MNSLILLSNFTCFLKSCNFADILFIDAEAISRLYFFLIPLFFNISFSSLLAREKGLDQIGTSLISMVCFFRASGFLNINSAAELTSTHGSILTSLLCTFISVSGVSLLSKVRFLRLFKNPRTISPRLRKTLNLTIPGLLTVLCIEVAAQGSSTFINTGTLSQAANLLPTFEQLNHFQELILYKTISLSTWMFGLHGEHTADGLFRLLQNIPAGAPRGITLKNFHDVFMNIGGSGSTLAVPFMILFAKQTQRFRYIARLSLPFSLVNVNEILLFGLPIILNPILFAPFFIAPFVNMLIAMAAIALGLFDVMPTPTVHWMTPPLYSAYLVSNGSFAAVTTQLVCIVADGFIYLPFLLLVNRQHQIPSSLANFLKKDAHFFLNEEINHNEERQFVTEQKHYLIGISEAKKVLKTLKGGTFLLYFQPKFDAQTLRLVGMEALLRLKHRTGKILPPTFLPILYQQGLSKAVDIKVVDLVFEQLLKWQQLNVSVPTISINFDKDFLCDHQAVQRLIDRAKEYQVRFYIEITEHTYTVQLEALTSVIKKLRDAGHKISIDDFGTGYSSLTSLLTLDADEIKLDRKLVVPPARELQRGHILLQSSIKLCHDLGFCVVAEGVETESQLHLLQACNVDIIQGYYLGAPMDSTQISHLFPTAP